MDTACDLSQTPSQLAMSYILEALKKSQHERELGKVPTVETNQLAAEARHGVPLRWVYTAVAMAAIAVLVALYGVYERRAAEPLEAVGDTLALSQTKAPPPAHASGTESGRPGSPGPAAPTIHLSSSPLPLESLGANAAADPEFASVPPPDIATLPSRGPETDSAPFLSEFPFEFQESVPDMTLDVHVYVETPAKRFVLINERRYRQGEHTTEGAIVQAIVPDGVVLRYEDDVFKLGL